MGLGHSKLIGGLLALFLGLRQGAEQFFAPLGQQFRQIGHLVQLARGFLRALFERTDLLTRARSLRSRQDFAFRRDGGEAFGADLGFPLQPVETCLISA